MWASTSPVAGLIEGSESTGMAVAAISAILTDFAAGRWPRHSTLAEMGSILRLAGSFALMVRLRCENLQVLGFPAHRVADAVPSAGVVEENPLFDRPTTHLSILAQANGGLREAVRPAAGV